MKQATKQATLCLILLALALPTLRVAEVTAQGWTQLTPPYSYTVTSCWVDDTAPDNGWFVGWRPGGDPVSYGYRTTDGGQSFTYVPFNYYFWLAEDVDFVDSNNGVSVGSGINHTTDGGDSWNLVVDLITMRGWMYDVMFPDSNNGYAVGQTYDDSYASYWGVIYKTINGGVSWTHSIITRETLNQNTEFRSVYSPAPGVVYAGGLNTSGVSSMYKSTDSGSTWSPLNFYRDVNALWFASPDIGYAATNHGIFQTTDAGSTWSHNVLPTSQALTSIDIKSNFGLSVGEGGQIYKTTDQGLNWTSMPSPVTTETLNHVQVVSSTLAFAVGTNGTILKYQDVTAMAGEEPIVGVGHSLLQNSPNPFSAATMMKYQVPVDGFVDLKVYDVYGKVVSTLIDEEKRAGSYEIDFDASDLPGGVYFCTLRAGAASQTNKLILTR